MMEDRTYESVADGAREQVSSVSPSNQAKNDTTPLTHPYSRSYQTGKKQVEAKVDDHVKLHRNAS